MSDVENSLNEASSLMKTQLNRVESSLSVLGIDFEEKIARYTNGFDLCFSQKKGKDSLPKIKLGDLLNEIGKITSEMGLKDALLPSMNSLKSDFDAFVPETLKQLFTSLETMTLTLEEASFSKAKFTAETYASAKDTLEKEGVTYKFSFSIAHPTLSKGISKIISLNKLMFIFEYESSAKKSESPKVVQTSGFAIEGKLLEQAITLKLLGAEAEKYYSGSLKVNELKLSRLFEPVDPDLSRLIRTYLDNQIGNLNTVITYDHGKDQNIMSLKSDLLWCSAIEYKNNLAFFIKLPFKNDNTSDSVFSKAMGIVEKYAGIHSVFFFYHDGTEAVPKKYFEKENGLPKTLTEIPKKLSSYNFYTYTDLQFKSDTIFCSAIRELLGVTALDLFIAYKKDGGLGTGILRLPRIDTPYVLAEDLYFQIDIEGSKGNLNLMGDFEFKFIPHVTFSTCSVMDPTGFVLSATANMPTPVTLYETVKMKDAGLMIGYNEGGLTFGLLANLFIGDLSLFGATVIKYQGAFRISMINAALSPCTLKTLIESFIGKGHLSIDALNQIGIQDFELQKKSPQANFDSGLIQAKSKEKVAKYMSDSLIFSESDKVEATELELCHYQNGLEVIDQKHLRHYFISSTGQIGLRTQFYCCLETETTQFGAYTLTPGVFVCGVVDFFGLKAEVLFSIKKDDKGEHYEEILAYAHIKPATLGPVSLKSSKFSTLKNPIQLPAKNAASQFIKPSTDGPVFYMLANSKSLDLFIDLGLKVLFFELDARLVYTNGLFDLKASFQTPLCAMTLKISADYGCIAKGKFNFELVLDPSVIVKNLTAVHEALQNSLTACNSKFASYENQLNQSRHHIEELNESIHYLEGCIGNCVVSIQRASWWEKAFVTVVKGAEIATYEVAKVGLYASIAAANAAIDLAISALEIGRSAMNLTSEVAAAINSLATTVLETAFNVFSIASLTLSAQADSSLNGGSGFSVGAKVQYTLLGQTNTASMTLKLSDATHMLKELCTSIGQQILSGSSSRLAQLSSGTLDPQVLKSGTGIPDIDLSLHEEDTSLGLSILSAYQNLIVDMGKLYYAEFGKPMTEFGNLVGGLIEGIACAQNVYNLAKDLTSAGEIQSKIAAVKSANGSLPTYFEDYNTALDLHKSVESTLLSLPDMAKALTQMDYNGVKVTGDQNMEHFLDQVAKLMAHYLSPFNDQETYINLIREPHVTQAFDKARLDANPNYVPPVILKKAIVTSPYTPRFGG